MINNILPVVGVEMVGGVVIVAGVEVLVAKEVDVNEDDTVSVVVAMVPGDVETVEAEFVVDRQPLASIKRNHSQNRIDDFII